MRLLRVVGFMVLRGMWVWVTAVSGPP